MRLAVRPGNGGSTLHERIMDVERGLHTDSIAEILERGSVTRHASP